MFFDGGGSCVHIFKIFPFLSHILLLLLLILLLSLLLFSPLSLLFPALNNFCLHFGSHEFSIKLVEPSLTKLHSIKIDEIELKLL